MTRRPKVRPGILLKSDDYQVLIRARIYKTLRGMRIACELRRKFLCRHGDITDWSSPYKVTAATLMYTDLIDRRSWGICEVYLHAAQGEWPFLDNVAHECQHVGAFMMRHGMDRRWIQPGMWSREEAVAHMTGGLTAMIYQYFITGELPTVYREIFAFTGWKERP